ncbi:MAG: hypothetical protein JSW00_14885 [Thermoplasmata archaeon]|nr:MAG: hypothetical protein JSW00_14885 [Thermoplasmata archaeon]
MKIEQTPQYPFIKTLIEQKSGQNTKEIYRQYIRRFKPEKDPNKALIQTEKLVESILSVSDFGSDVTIITYPPKYNRKIRNYEVRIYDGVRRASIAKVLGFEYITCRLK